MSSERQFTFDGEPIFLLGEKVSGLPAQRRVQDFDAIRKLCVSSKVLFDDPEFPASDSSLFFSRKPDKEYKWLRPREIGANPQFFVDGHSRFDIRQGLLGNCWLLAAAACLSEKQILFDRVVCPDNSFTDDYAGIFHFRFWQYGKWVEVCIDDKLPTYNGKLVYMRSSTQNEFWSALLEKAYAKLHGSYEALVGGFVCEGLQDFTGGVTEKYDLKKSDVSLFRVMEKAFETNSMVGCSIKPERGVIEGRTPQGLVQGHAYSINKVAMADVKTPNKSGKIPLVCIRNPWGNGVEWNGAWSDKAPEWQFISSDTKRALSVAISDDGEFWMSFQDFLKYFDDMEICTLSPESLTEGTPDVNHEWQLLPFEGAWVSGLSAGGCSINRETFAHNPKFVMSLTEDDKDDDGQCSVVVGLLQKHRRSKRHVGLKDLTIGFAVYRINENGSTEDVLDKKFFSTHYKAVKSPTFTNLREVSGRYKMPPGQYVVVPSTYDQNNEGEFLVRIFSKSSSSFQEYEGDVEIVEIEADAVSKKKANVRTSNVARMFTYHDETNKEVGWAKIQEILNTNMDTEIPQFRGFSEDLCRSMISMMDTNFSGKLDVKELTIMMNLLSDWIAAFKKFAKKSDKFDATELRDVFASIGFRLNSQILCAVFYRYGSDDKTISFENFIRSAIKAKFMVQMFKSKDHKNAKEASFALDEWVAMGLIA